jgi:diguanylate cyclase (GGDEF)-like protein
VKRLATFMLGLGLAAAAAAAAPPAPASASAPAREALAAWQDEVDGWVERGLDDPQAATAALATMAARPPLPGVSPAAQQRVLWLGRGLVAASAGRASAAAQALAALHTLQAAEPLAGPDRQLIEAALADHREDGAATLAAAEAADRGYASACPAAPGCDTRSHWFALTLLARHEARRGHVQAALERSLAAAEVARIGQDRPRQATALAVAADHAHLQGDAAQSQRLLGQALRMARIDGSALLQSRLLLADTRLRARSGDPAGARRAAESGLAAATRAHSPRLQAMHLANLSDLAVKGRQPQAALRAVERALPLARSTGLQRVERVLMHNAALAQVALGQVAAARQTLATLRDGARAGGAPADEALALREFAEAFAAAGDLKGALELFHQERALVAEMMAANRDATLAQLRQRSDRESQQRQLEQLARENTLMASQLANRSLLHQLWAAGAVALLAAGVLVGLLYRRVRAVNRQLSHNHAFLRAQSQRDPLTGLANRRGLHEAVPADRPFAGALLLVDIDHFKHINDGHGHAAGDVVLVEVARRLQQVVRADDLVVRWGGEEFLIHMPAAQPAQAHALAERVLQAVGAEPVRVGPQLLRVTVSVGHVALPLAPARLPLSLERAINLADMALYMAKGQGRNRTVGIAEVQAADDDALRGVEADVEQAWRDGRVTLQRSSGPVAERAAERAAVPAGAA